MQLSIARTGTAGPLSGSDARHHEEIAGRQHANPRGQGREFFRPSTRDAGSAALAAFDRNRTWTGVSPAAAARRREARQAGRLDDCHQRGATNVAGWLPTRTNGKVLLRLACVGTCGWPCPAVCTLVSRSMLSRRMIVHSRRRSAQLRRTMSSMSVCSSGLLRLSPGHESPPPLHPCDAANPEHCSPGRLAQKRWPYKILPAAGCPHSVSFGTLNLQFFDQTLVGPSVVGHAFLSLTQRLHMAPARS